LSYSLAPVRSRLVPVTCPYFLASLLLEGFGLLGLVSTALTQR
jgi:hypothetical protein